MVDISAPQGPKDPYQKIRVEPVEEKKEKEEFEKKEWEKPKNAFAAIIAQSFKKFIHLLFGGEARRFQITPLTMIQYIQNLLEALEKLQKEDCSQDLDFLNLFSKYWGDFVSASHRYDGIAKKKITAFIQEFSQYTQEFSHSLSYYLTEYADSEWIPFPFMEMLHNLSDEHQKLLEQSQLAIWTDKLKEIVSILHSAQEN